MKEWLSGIVGESAANIVGFILIFAIILGGIFVVLSIIRRFSGGTFVSNGRTRQPRLSVMDAAAVDSRRKLVLIRRDDVEHLLLIGGPTDVVVEQNIVMESRAHARVQASRIEPEHIERFKQHEATLTNERRSALLFHCKHRRPKRRTKRSRSRPQLKRRFIASLSQHEKSRSSRRLRLYVFRHRLQRHPSHLGRLSKRNPLNHPSHGLNRARRRIIRRSPVQYCRPVPRKHSRSQHVHIRPIR